MRKDCFLFQQSTGSCPWALLKGFETSFTNSAMMKQCAIHLSVFSILLPTDWSMIKLRGINNQPINSQQFLSSSFWVPLTKSFFTILIGIFSVTCTNSLYLFFLNRRRVGRSEHCWTISAVRYAIYVVALESLMSQRDSTPRPFCHPGFHLTNLLQ